MSQVAMRASYSKVLLPQPIIGATEKQSSLKWFILFLGCFCSFSTSMSQYFPSIMQNELMEELTINYLQYNLLYSIQSVPNIVIALFGGIFVSKTGAPLAMVLLSTVKLGASIVWLFATEEKSFTMLVVGRLLFGMTTDTLGIGQSVMIAKWFASSGQQGAALSTTIMMYGLGCYIGSWLLPLLLTAAPASGNAQYSSNILYLPVLALVATNVLGLVSVLLMAFLDSYASTSTVENIQQIVNQEQENQDPILETMKKFSSLFWKLSILCMIGYASYLPMLMNTQTLFHGIYGVSTDRASQLFGICNLIEICLLPFVGYFVDATGKRALYLIAAFAILVLTTLCMLLGVPSPQHCLATLTYAQKKHCIEGAMFPTALIGLFQALFEGSIWICTQLVVAPAHIGLSQGVICSLYNLGMAVVPMLIGYFLDSSSLEIGYKLVLYTQLLLAFLSLILSFEVHFQDKNSTHHRVLYEIENCAVLESANYKLLVPPESSMAAGDEKAEQTDFTSDLGVEKASQLTSDDEIADEVLHKKEADENSQTTHRSIQQSASNKPIPKN